MFYTLSISSIFDFTSRKPAGDVTTTSLGIPRDTNTSNISTILETNHNVNAVTNTNTSNASFRLSSNVNTSNKIIKKEFCSNSSNYFSNVSDSSPSKSNSENNPSIINLFSWDEFLSDHEEVIPPDASLLPLSFVAIPGMKLSVEKGSILNMDIAEIKHRVGDQLCVLIYKPYIVQEHILYFEKSYILTCLEIKDVIRLAHP